MSEGPIQPQLTLEEAHREYEFALADFLELRKTINERYSGFFTRFYRKRLNESEKTRFEKCYERFATIITAQSAKEEFETMRAQGDYKPSIFYKSTMAWLDMSSFLSQFKT